MRQLKKIEQKADGFLNSYALHYDCDGEEVVWDMVSVNKLEGESDIAKNTTGVNIVARFEDGDILLCEEFRFPVNDYCWEFPGGIIDEGETPEEAAIRELHEETGLEVVRVDRVLPRAFPLAGVTDASLSVVFVTVKGSLYGQHTAWEDIRPHKLSRKQVLALLARDDLRITLDCRLILTLLFEPEAW